MINLYYYTDSEKKEIINSIVILVDTREKEGKNNHIIEFFDSKKIKYKKKSLKYGDYSFYIPKNEKLGIYKDLYFDSEIIIERKASLEEISGNLSSGRDRFEKELALAPLNKVLLIEGGSFDDICSGNYNTEYNKKSFLASLFTFWFRYTIPVFFMPNNKYTGIFIRYFFEYYIREKLH